MCDKGKIIQIMEEKRRLLASIEEVTQEMITCSDQQLETLMTRRDKLVAELQRADKEMKALCDGQEDGPAVLDAALCKSEPEELSGELAEIYRAGQQHRAIFLRLRESELQAILRLKQEQLEILDKIKNTNQGAAAKASRFFSVGSPQGGGFSRLGHA